MSKSARSRDVASPVVEIEANKQRLLQPFSGKSRRKMSAALNASIAIMRELDELLPQARAARARAGGTAQLVVLPATDYERLVDAAEEREAVLAFERTRGEETVPSAIVERLSAGEHPVRVWREHRGLTLERLGALAGRSKSYLSEIEAGKRRGSLETLAALARALRIDRDDLLPWRQD